MSADLFAAFGSGVGQCTHDDNLPTKVAVPAHNLLIAVDDVDEDAEDDFGDYEVADTDLTEKSGAPALPMAQAMKYGKPTRNIDVLFDAMDHAGVQEKPVIATEISQEALPKAANSGGPKTPKVLAQTSSNLISFEDVPTQKSVPFRPAEKHTERSTNAVQEETWNNFETVEQPPTGSSRDSIRLPVLWSDSIMSTPSQTSDLVPPTMIPPPSVLLNLFVTLLDEIAASFLRPVSALSTHERHDMLDTPDTLTFFQAYCKVGTVFAHVLAGRRLRWKRDKILAQSMSIGHATSGRSSGMKLTGLDKGESVREDRDALDALKAWKAQAGRFRSILSSYSATAASHQAVQRGESLPALPEMAETMPVRIVKAAEGGITALHPCGLCGLKRDERVSKIDSAIQDSFGEWWLDNARMHVTCWSFWHSQSQTLAKPG